MFGLTFEKLLLVGLIAAVVIGPQRLPGVVAWVASLVRGLRRTVDAARLRAATELGVPADAAQWHALDPRQYDPRRIIAEALAAPPAAVAGGAASGEAPGPAGASLDDAPGPAASLDDVSVPADRAPAPVGGRVDDGGAPARVRRVRVGTSAHPRWIEVPDEAPTEPPSPAAEGALDGLDTSAASVPPAPGGATVRVAA